jgi:hypothetical protein
MRPLSLALPAVLVAVAVLMTLRRGIGMTPDSWAYWQGSVSLLEGRGYVLFDGRPIRAWPPGYSAYLAVVQAVLGVSGWTLAVATACAAGTAAAAWTLLLWRYAAMRGASAASVWWAVLFLSATLVLHTRSLLSEHVFHVALPLALLAGLRARTAQSPRAVVLWTVASAALAGILVLTRYVGLVFAPGLAALAAGSRARWPTFAVVVATPLGVLSALRALLGTADHPLGLDRAQFELGELLRELVDGLGTNTSLPGAGQVLLLACAGAMLARDRTAQRNEGAALLLTVASALLLLVVVFRVTWVADPLRGRFTLFATLVLGACGIVDASDRRRLHCALAVCLTAVPAVRAGKHAVRGRPVPPPAFTACPHEQGVPWDAAIRRPGDRRERDEAGRTLLAPPPFPW